MLFASVYCTRDFLLNQSQSNFKFLANFYCITLVIFLILTAISLGFSFYLLKKDHQTWLSAFILNPMVTFLCILIPASPFIVDNLFYNHTFLHPKYYPGIFWFIFLPIVAWYVFRVLLPANKISETFKERYDYYRKINKMNKNHLTVTKLMTYLCDEMDLNNAESESEYKKLKDIITEYPQNILPNDELIFEELTSDIFKTIDDLAEKNFAKNDQLSLIIKFKACCLLWDEA